MQQPNREQKKTLLIGFDSAWTAHNFGAIVGVRRWGDGRFDELGSPQIVDYLQAEAVIARWQAELTPTATIVLLDQPTIVRNTNGQRPVENIVACPVSLRYVGMQPANISKEEMFGPAAPIWRFLARFGGPVNPHEAIARTANNNPPQAMDQAVRLRFLRLAISVFINRAVPRQNAIRRRKWAWFTGSAVVLAIAFASGSVVR
jgi:hypothetical protein